MICMKMNDMLLKLIVLRNFNIAVMAFKNGWFRSFLSCIKRTKRSTLFLICQFDFLPFENHPGNCRGFFFKVILLTHFTKKSRRHVF